MLWRLIYVTHRGKLMLSALRYESYEEAEKHVTSMYHVAMYIVPDGDGLTASDFVEPVIPLECYIAA